MIKNKEVEIITREKQKMQTFALLGSYGKRSLVESKLK
jgi:hypothetical protein